MDYIEHEGNVEVQQAALGWLEQREKGMYYIVGRNGSGKTTFMKSFVEKYRGMFDEKVCWLSTDILMSECLKNVINEEEFDEKAPGDIVVVDNIELLIRRRSTAEMLKTAFQKWLENGCRYIFCIGAKLVPEFCKVSTVIPFTEIEIDEKAVKRVAEQESIVLDETSLRELSGVKSMPELQGAVRRQHLLGKTITKSVHEC